MSPVMLSKPPAARATPVFVRAAPGATPAEELYLLAALEAVAHAESGLRFRYGTPHPEVQALLTRRWFLEETALIASEPGWQSFTGAAIALTMPEPDPIEALAAEQALYDAWHAAETGKIQRQQAAVNAAGMKDLVLPLPEHRFQSGWHKSNGYVWSLGDYLGAPVAVPSRPLPPFGELPRDLERDYLRRFQKAGFTRRPFLLYDLEAEASPFSLLGSMGQAFGDIQWLSVAEVAGALAVEPGALPLAALLALCGHPNARFAVGPVGTLLTCAWAAGLPNLLELYSGANPAWDGVQSPNSLRVERDRFPAAELPQIMSQAADLLVHRAR